MGIKLHFGRRLDVVQKGGRNLRELGEKRDGAGIDERGPMVAAKQTERRRGICRAIWPPSPQNIHDSRNGTGVNEGSLVGDVIEGTTVSMPATSGDCITFATPSI